MNRETKLKKEIEKAKQSVLFDQSEYNNMMEFKAELSGIQSERKRILKIIDIWVKEHWDYFYDTHLNQKDNFENIKERFEELKESINQSQNEQNYDYKAMDDFNAIHGNIASINQSQEIDVEGKPLIPPTLKASGNASSVTPDINNQICKNCGKTKKQHYHKGYEFEWCDIYGDIYGDNKFQPIEKARENNDINVKQALITSGAINYSDKKKYEKARGKQ